MIGLGSNRLTVCRRGGMSVTQAGRGGMEWLAGGRMPLWAQWWLPYSRQAGEALKAAFPTQWATIRDYGFAHPEIVPYVNQYPIGWGNIIVSYQLCEYVQGNGSQYLKIPFSGTSSGFDIFNVRYTPVNNGWPVVSNWTSGSGQGFNLDTNGDWRFWLGYGNGELKLKNNFTGLAWDKQVDLKYSRAEGTLTVNEQTINYAQTSIPTGLNYIYVFALGFGNNVQSYYSKSKVHEMHIKSPSDEIYLFACYNKESGVIGMYDVVNCEFMTNAGSGTFLKGSDIYYPGQSPS